jgi:hypothetical protein
MSIKNNARNMGIAKSKNLNANYAKRGEKRQWFAKFALFAPFALIL